MPVILFSRPIRTGKTTELLHWCRQQTGVLGIAMPDINERRMMMQLDNGELFEAQCTADTEEAIISIGPFRFYAAAFERANEILLAAAAQQPGWLVLDEAGKLELVEDGFYPAVKKLVALYQSESAARRNLLLVVRDSLLEQVIRFFDIKNPVIIHSLQDLI